MVMASEEERERESTDSTVGKRGLEDKIFSNRLQSYILHESTQEREYAAAFWSPFLKGRKKSCFHIYEAFFCSRFFNLFSLLQQQRY